MEDLFGTQSEAWTRFHALTAPGELDNLDIFEDLSTKLKDDFECYRRKDGSVIVDSKTKRNAEIVEQLQQIKDKDISTSRDQQLNSVRGTILVPLSEFGREEAMEERILNHLLLQKIPASKVTIFRKISRNKKSLV